jgi:hypothetical protein
MNMKPTVTLLTALLLGSFSPAHADLVSASMTT